MDTRVFEEYRLCNDLMRKKQENPDAFKARLRRGLLCLMTRIKRNLEAQVLGTFNAEVGSLVLTLPTEWTLDFETEMASLWGQTFGWTQEEIREKIHFYTEGEAMANFLFRDARTLRLLEIEEGVYPDAVKVLDYGGHNMVSNYYTKSYTCILAPTPAANGDGTERRRVRHSPSAWPQKGANSGRVQHYGRIQ